MSTPPRSPELRAAGSVVGWTLIALALASLAPASVAQQDQQPATAPASPASAPAAAATAPARPSARDFVTKALGEITGVLKDRTQTSQVRREKIQDLVRRWLDAEVISKLALAKHWKAFDESQQKEFVDSFRSHLVLTYYRNVDRFEFERIEIYDARDEKSKQGDWTVRTKVIAPRQDDVLIDLRLRPTADGTDWKVIDIFIEGVSLVQNFRSQFAEMLSGGSPGQLLASLRDRNASTLKQYEESEAKEAAAKGAPSKG